MTKGQVSHSSATKFIDLDVLIIGGGVQGLWLLQDLRQEKYGALLLERRELGGEQTCHSHVYIHQGHLYREGQEGLVERLRDVNALWEEWIHKNKPEYGFCPSYFGFQNPADADLKEILWQKLQLNYTQVSEPPILNGSPIRRVLKSPEICLNGESLVEKLCQGSRSRISSLQKVERVSTRGSDTNWGKATIENVEVVMPGHKHLIFRPRALVLAAGAGNQALLELIAGGHRAQVGPVRDAQQIRKAHMLVIKGRRRDLKPLTGVFPDLGGLFLVARELKDENAVLWLISDDRSQTLSFLEDWMEYDARQWLQRVLLSLQRLAPRCFRDEETLRRLQWGVYDAPKAEGRSIGGIPHEERIEQFGFENLWTIWPTKLTLAPKVSQKVTSEIRDLIGAPVGWTIPQAWKNARLLPGMAPERWKKTPLMTWDKFCQCFAVDYI